MGEVIHFDFKNKKKEGSSERGLEDESSFKRDDDRKVGREEAKQYLKFLKFLTSGSAKELVALSVSSTSFSSAQELVKDYKTEELIDWLEKTNEKEWKKKAAFFQAIFGELKSRLITKKG